MIKVSLRVVSFPSKLFNCRIVMLLYLMEVGWASFDRAQWRLVLHCKAIQRPINPSGSWVIASLKFDLVLALFQTSSQVDYLQEMVCEQVLSCCHVSRFLVVACSRPGALSFFPHPLSQLRVDSFVNLWSHFWIWTINLIRPLSYRR